jgi:hypothetical protein
MGVLRRLGLDLGPADTLVPAILGDNPDSYLEQRAFVDLDDELLASHGGHVSDPGLAPPGWAEGPEYDERRARAAALIAKTFTGEHWGWKDPRAALLLPFWRTVDPGLRVLICVRNPVEVVGSMMRRHPDACPRGHWARMWLRYTADALRDSDGSRRAVLLYEDLLAAPEREAQRLGAFLRGTDPPEDVVAAAAAVIRPDARRNRASDSALVDDADVPAEVAATYLAIRAATRSGEPLEPVTRLTGALRDGVVANDAADARNRAAAVELAQLRARHAQLAQSRSWRLTAPLRTLAEKTRRVLRNQ